MNKSALSALTVAKLNIISVIVPNTSINSPLLVAASMYIATNIIMLIVKLSGTENIGYASIGTWLFMLVLLSAMSITPGNFYRIINLGGKRKNFFEGCILTYIILAFSVSVLNTLIFYTLDVFMKNLGILSQSNIFETFNWVSHGVVVGCIMQFAFLLFIAALVHTVMSIRLRWSTLVIFLIIVFTVILVKPLYNAVSQFFKIIFYHSNAFVQIISCLVLAAVIYAISLPVINRKRF